MPPAVPVVAAAAGAWAAGSVTAAAIGGFYLGSAALGGALAGFAVTTAVNTLGSRLLSQKPKAAAFTSDARPCCVPADPGPARMAGRATRR